MNKKIQATVEVSTWFRDSTNEWVGELAYRAGGTSGTGRYTGATEAEARNAAFAAIGYQLLETTFDAARGAED
jgi:hypothetical protein